jgi:hypothetical protein
MSNSSLTPENFIRDPKQTPPGLTRYAQGVLLLFSIASVIKAWSGGALGTIILIVVVVIGFAIATLGFERLSKNQDPFYSYMGKFLTSVTLIAVTILFLTVLIYIGTGHPVWLDRFFPQSTTVASLKS